MLHSPITKLTNVSSSSHILFCIFSFYNWREILAPIKVHFPHLYSHALVFPILTSKSVLWPHIFSKLTSYFSAVSQGKTVYLTPPPVYSLLYSSLASFHTAIVQQVSTAIFRNKKGSSLHLTWLLGNVQLNQLLPHLKKILLAFMKWLSPLLLPNW